MDFRSCFFEVDFNFRYINNKLDIVNYKSIDTVLNDRVVITYSDGIFEVTGNDLRITKLTADEVLITGLFKKIEFRWLNVFKFNWYKVKR